MPDLISFHQSITDELNVVKDRIRNLVKHWPTDGEWKEAALRTVLRRHLPLSTFVGRGFIIGRDISSTQIDLLVLKPDKPALFRDGDLVIVSYDAAGAIVEVKTKLEGYKAWYDAALKLAQIAVPCRRVAQKPWLGLFSYEGKESEADSILNVLHSVYKEMGVVIDSVSCGDSIFIRYWHVGEFERGGDRDRDYKRKYWRAYKLENLAPSYFISNLIQVVSKADPIETDYIWFALKDGKIPHIIAEKFLDKN